MEEVYRDQNNIQYRPQTSANSEHPTYCPTPRDYQSLAEGGILSEEKDAVSTLRIMSHKPAEPRHSSGKEQRDYMCGDNGH
jgi:hypothetical protein